MKTTIKSIFSLFLLLVMITGCGKDNYDAPDSYLTGRIVYNGKPIPVRGSDERVRLQLYQDGYEYQNPIEVFVTQDGSFSSLLFDGEYKMVTRDNNGPWVNSRDTTEITVKGNTYVDFEVTPYFTISDEEITLSANVITAKFTINKIVESAEMDRIILLAGQTAFVDDDYKILRVDWTENLQTGTVTYTAELNDESKEALVLNARICVWTKGADQGIYSSIVKLK